MPLVVCQDFFGLEDELFRRIDAVKRENPTAAVAVVVPTSRILTRLRRLILESGRTYLGLHLLHHLAFAERILETSPSPVPRMVGSELLQPLLQAVLETRTAPGPLARYALQYPGARATLLGTLTDLRDAQADPETTSEILAKSATVRELGEIFKDYNRALGTLESLGLTDTCGLIGRAITFVHRSEFLESLKELFHFGAYDLIQIHQNLLLEVSRKVPVTLLVPGIGDGPAFGYAKRFLDRPLVLSLGSPEPINAPGSGLFSDRLHHLYDEGAAPGPSAAATKCEVLTAAGDRLELEAVARRALQAHHEGIPLHEIGVVARTLEPYAAHLEAVFDAFSLPFVTSAVQPLLRYPGPLAFRKLLRILDDDFPRSQVIELFRSAAFRLKYFFGKSEPVRPDRWDLWSREAGIVVGRHAWLERLPRWARRREERAGLAADSDRQPDPADRSGLRDRAGQRSRECGRLAELIETLSREADEWAGQDSWSRHAAFLRRLAGKWLHGFQGETDGPEHELENILGGLASQELGETAAGKSGFRPSRSQIRKRLETVLADATYRETSQSEEGVAVLDAMQARGSSFRVLFLIGLTTDQWPRRIHPDPFLPDPDRHRLGEALELQIPVKETAREEDRLLLALLLGAARERLILSYQRADDAGRVRAHSSVWREIARIVKGEAESAALLERGEVRILPTDPSRRAEFEMNTRTGGAGILRKQEAVILSAATAGDPVSGLLERMNSLGELDPGIRQGAVAIRAVNHWSGTDLSRDGAIGETLPEREFLSASRVETMGKCPLQYFFRYGLQVEELDEPESEDWIDRGQVGTVTHAALEKIYSRLMEEKKFPIQDLREIIGYARELLHRLGEQELAPLRDPLTERYPLLWSIYEEDWYQALESFLAFDLARLQKENAEPILVEHEIRRTVSLPTREKTQPVGLRGIIDRIDAIQGGDLRIADYKTSRNLKPRVHPNQLLRGTQAQMGVYAFLAAAEFSDRRIRSAQILGVGPENPDPAGDPKKTAPEIEFPNDPRNDPIWRGIGDTIGTLVEMIRRGVFPIRPGTHCDWCSYQAACRRNHPPTLDRIESAALFRGFHELSLRSTKTPLGPEENP